MNLCTLQSLKDMLSIEPEQTKHDHLLTLIIAAVSSQLEKHLNRTVLSGSYTEYFDVHEGACRFAVKAYPVTAITSVTNAPDWQWSTGSTVSSTYINYTSPFGVINLYSTTLAVGPNALRVIYTGGMAASTEALESGDYADVALAACEQAVAVWNNRRNFGVQSAGVASQSVSFGSVTLLDSVVQLLAPHRRPVSV